MIKTFLYSMFGVFLFALGAGGAWYFFNVQLANSSPGGESLQSTLVANDKLELPAVPEVEPIIPPISPAAVESDEPLPTVAPSKPISAEEIFRFGVINRKRMEKLQEREKALDERERRMQLEYKDLEARQAEVEGLLAHINDTLTAGESLLSQINTKRLEMAEEKSALESQKEEHESKTGLSPEDQQANERQAAALIEAMNSETAADVIKEFANSGKMDFALALIEQMEERNGAKILDAINDPALLADMTSKLRERRRLKVSAKPKQKR